MAVKVKERDPDGEDNEELQNRNHKKGQSLASDDLRRCGSAGAESVPCIPAVLDEERKAGHPHNVEAIDHGFTGHHLFGAIGTPVAVGAEGEGEHGLEEGYEEERKDDENHDGERVAREQAELMKEDRTRSSRRHRPPLRSGSTRW
jgi:hypothetical protein